MLLKFLKLCKNKNIKAKKEDAKKTRLLAMTIIETVISLALISVTLMAMFDSLNYIYRANLYIDDRLAIRDQTTFMIRYLSERLRNANPISIQSPNTSVTIPNSGNGRVILEWNAVGQRTIYRLVYQENLNHPYFVNSKYSRLLLQQTDNNGSDWYSTVLTYPTANIKSVTVNIGTIYTDKLTMLNYRTVNLILTVDSTRMLGTKPLVRDVVKYLNVLAVN